MVAKDPLVSVIMPVRNEAFFIAHGFGAVLPHDYPPANCVSILPCDACIEVA